MLPAKYFKEGIDSWPRHKAFLQGWTNTNQQQNSQSDAFVKVPVLHCDGHQQASDEQHVWVFQIFNTDLKQITNIQSSKESQQPSLINLWKCRLALHNCLMCNKSERLVESAGLLMTAVLWKGLALEGFFSWVQTKPEFKSVLLYVYLRFLGIIYCCSLVLSTNFILHCVLFQSSNYKFMTCSCQTQRDLINGTKSSATRFKWPGIFWMTTLNLIKSSVKLIQRLAKVFGPFELFNLLSHCRLQTKKLKIKILGEESTSGT